MRKTWGILISDAIGTPHSGWVNFRKESMFARYRQITLIAVAVTIFMMGLTLAYWYKEHNQAADKRRQAFNESANQILNNINLRLLRYELLLRGVKGFYESSDLVTGTEYHDYFNALQMRETVPGFQAAAIALYVPHAKKAQYLAQAQSRGYAALEIQPAGNRSAYAPITLIEPHTGDNLKAMGYDLFSNPKTKFALDEARDHGKAALTSKLVLVQDAGKDIPAVVMYVPIYDITKPLNTVEDRRAAIQGWVSGPFRLKDFVASMLVQLENDLALEIRQGDELLYRDDKAYTDLSTTRYLHIGGKRWDISVHSLPAFDARFSASKLDFLVIGGLLLSVLFGWLIWLLGSSRERAVMLAQNMTKELRQTKSDLECTLNAIPDLLFELDSEGRYLSYHTKNISLLAVPNGQLIGKKMSEVLPREAADICMEALHEAALNGMSSGQEIALPFGDEIRWFELSVAKRDDSTFENPHFVMISRDITDKKIASNQLSIAAIAFESQEAMFVTSADNLILRVNRAYSTITGYSAEEAVGRSPSMLKSGRHDKHFYASMWHSINHNGSWMGEIWNRRKNREQFPCQLSITAVKDAQGLVTNYVATMIDISFSKAASDEIKTLAFYDPLTRLPNRRLLLDRLKQALASCTRSHNSGALLFLDIDHFKNINDTLGHDIGDVFLQEVAHRISQSVRAGDTVARLGGDEYVVLLEGLAADSLTAAADVEAYGYKILKALSETYYLGTHQCRSSVSIGAVLFDKHKESIDELLKQADIAMYEAKNAGRNALRFFDPQMQLAIAARTELERELRIAVENNEFELYYQLQVDSEHRPLGAEALIRWRHPERGLISPIEFIPLAEETGLIVEIGQWVLDAACAQLKIWEHHAHTSHLKLSVNVSAKQFHQENFVHNVTTTLARHRVKPELLNMELTESALLNDTERAIANMNELKNLGVRFELDDFGTGYSSLQYLKRLPLYQLKIDQSFVRDIGEDANDRALVTTIIQLSHSLGLKVIAEGVETSEQLTFLRENGCDHYQGYYFSQPVTIGTFEALLNH